MAPRARRMALIAASVPEETSRSISMEGIARAIRRGHLDLALGGRAVARAPSRRVPERFHHRGMGMAENQGTPRAEEIDVGAPVHVLDARARRARHEEGCAADPAERAHGAVDAARHEAACRGEERLGAAHRAVRCGGDGLPAVNSSWTKSRRAGSHAKALASAGPPRDHRDHHVHRLRVGRLAVHQGVALVRLREVRAGIDVGVIDRRHAIALGLAPADGEQVAGIDVVRGARVARVALGILAVQLVLDVPARQQESLRRRARAGEHHPATLGGILVDGLRLDSRVFLRGQRHAGSPATAIGARRGPACPPARPACPPARAGIIETSSPSFSAVASPFSDSMASLFT